MAEKSIIAKYDESDFLDDDFDFNFHYENFLEKIDDEFKQHIDKNVNVVAKNMGWQNLNGETNFTLEKPKDILDKIKVDADFTMYVYKLGKNKYHIKQSHHDAPMGENYYITITK